MCRSRPVSAGGGELLIYVTMETTRTQSVTSVKKRKHCTMRLSFLFHHHGMMNLAAELGYWCAIARDFLNKLFQLLNERKITSV